MTYTFTGNIKKYPAALLLLIFMCATLFAPVMVMAGTKKIGESCSSSIGGDSECRSGDCEDSSKVEDNDDFCDCNDDNDCDMAYGTEHAEVTKWECWDGAHATYDLDYCVGTGPNIQKPIVEYAIPPREADFVDKLLDPQVTLDEIQRTIQKPQPKITIPGLEFSEAKTVVDRGRTYMIFPFLGEYITAIYRYAVVAASALAVLVIIVSGIQWMLPGNLLTSGEGDSTQTTNQAKKRIGGALVGLTIAVGSYTILYLVNPELVKFKNLRVEVVEKIDLSVFNKTSSWDDTYGINKPIVTTVEIDKLFTAYAGCYGLNKNVLTAIGKAESGLRPYAMTKPGGTYQGLFQESEAYCKSGLRKGKYPDTLKLTCKNRLDPETNTAAAAYFINRNLDWILKDCEQITAEAALALLYVGHNHGEGTLKNILGRGNCSNKASILASFQHIYPAKGGKNTVTVTKAIKKFKYGWNKVVPYGQSAGITLKNPAKTELKSSKSSSCPKTTQRRALKPSFCSTKYTGHSVLALGDSNTQYANSYVKYLQQACGDITFEKIAVHGKNAAWAYNQIKDKDLSQYNTVIVWSGVNGITNAQRDLGKIYNKIKNTPGVRLVKIPVTPWKGYGQWDTTLLTKTKEVNSFIRNQSGVFIDVYDNFGISGKPDTLNPNYARDKIHLNPAGHQILADKVIKTAFQ
ncbi:MAG: transglycosylase SLT domain-containing protein [Candidatus Magasanikbacteria bacterium]|nr:transglycosylase SLT domain-containing protein [Candidatus Magasanikbacteria bacterium]